MREQQGMSKIHSALSSMAGHRVYIDTNVFIFFLERDDALFELAADFIKACASRDILGVTGELVIAEVMVHPYRSGDAALISRFKSFFGRKNFLSIAEHEARFFDEAAMLAGQKRLKLMDAIHYRTALQAGCSFFLTHDADFDAVASGGGLEVVRLSDLVEA
jgi:predicted nucleic acid-binding protein